MKKEEGKKKTEEKVFVEYFQASPAPLFHFSFFYLRSLVPFPSPQMKKEEGK